MAALVVPQAPTARRLASIHVHQVLPTHAGEFDAAFEDACERRTIDQDLVAQIHDRMPVIIPPDSYDRWLANIEPDPRDLLVPFPSELMRMWPISTPVNKPENDDPSLLDPIEGPDGGPRTLV